MNVTSEGLSPAELPAIAKAVDTWDGENLKDLLPYLRRYEAIKKADESGLIPDDNEVVIAVVTLGCRDDQPWPEPWGDEDDECPFAYACDRRGQYITQAIPYFEGEYEVKSWEPGITCGDI